MTLDLSPLEPGPERLASEETAKLKPEGARPTLETTDPVSETPPASKDEELSPTATPPNAPATDGLEHCLNRAIGSRFEVLRPIAIGGMAVLFLLRHRATEGMFVAKMMRTEFLNEAALREAFAREARIGSQLAGHPNAVAILDLDTAEGNTPFLLMPYIEGEDLDHVLESRGPLERDEALMLLAQLGSLLMYAETMGIVHADIALGNIRLDRFGQYRLLDYGLAHGPDEALDTLHTRAGTPAYNSPEQLRGEPLDIRSDLYSLGLVLFHALTGRSAFATEDITELAQAHLTGAWQLPAEFREDRAVCALLCSLLATDRTARMASAFELSGAMAALGYELPSFLRAFPGSSPVPRLRRRRLEVVGD